MKFAIVFAALLAVAIAAPAPAPAPQQRQPQEEAQVLRYDSDVQPDGYKFFVETSDGKTHQEEGQLKDAGTDHEAIVVRGSFSYIGDDGVTYKVDYVADENGFQPQGEHIPHAQ